MVEGILLAVGLAVLMALDLMSAVGRAAFQESNYSRLLALRDELGSRLNRTLSLWHVHSRLIASFNWILIFTRFLLAGWVLYILFRWLPSASFLLAVAVLLLSGWVIFALEWVVSAAARREPERWAIRLTSFMRVLNFVATPFVALPLAFTREVRGTSDATGSVTEDELKTLVDAGEEEGIFEQGEREMIYSVIELGDTLAREIMVPRIDVLALEVGTPLEEAVDELLKSGHSRVPVYAETVDNTLGLLYAKDLLRVWREGGQLGSLRDLLRPAYFVPEAKKVDELLAEMQRQRIHMAIVVDEYGGVAGIVSLEDIVEEILGEIQDEYDQAEESPYQALKNGEFVFQGRVDLDDFNQVMGSNLPKDEADTLGGYLYSRLGHVPAAGECVRWDNLELVVEQVNARRIRKVRARWLLTDTEYQEEI
jgi:putative hemolysin